MNFDELLTELKIDGPVLRSRFAGMDNIAERFLMKFPGDATFQLLKQALDEGQMEEAERAAHTLKGVAANLGLDDLSSRAAACVNLIRSDDLEGARGQYSAISTEYERIVQILSRYP